MNQFVPKLHKSVSQNLLLGFLFETLNHIEASVVDTINTHEIFQKTIYLKVYIMLKHHKQTKGICENLENIPSDIPRRIFLPVYRYGCPNSGAQKRKFMFYNRIFFFLLNPSKVYSQVRKNTLLIVNHSKA